MMILAVNAHEGILTSEGKELHSVTSTILTRTNTVRSGCLILHGIMIVYPAMWPSYIGGL